MRLCMLHALLIPLFEFNHPDNLGVKLICKLQSPRNLMARETDLVIDGLFHRRILHSVMKLL
jgi:hypothetical protein